MTAVKVGKAMLLLDRLKFKKLVIKIIKATKEEYKTIIKFLGTVCVKPVRIGETSISYLEYHDWFHEGSTNVQDDTHHSQSRLNITANKL